MLDSTSRPERRTVLKAGLGVATATLTGVAARPASAATTSPVRPDRAAPGRAASPRWSAEAALPVARAEVGVAALHGLVYVAGGTLQTGTAAPAWASTRVDVYDPRRNRWHAAAPLPVALTHVGLAASHGRLFAFGGFTDAVHLHARSTAFVYDPRTNRWTTLPALPTARGSVGVAAVGGCLHVIGGRDSHEVVTPPKSPVSLGFGTLRRHDVFDPERGTWATGPDLPGEPRDHMGIAVRHGRIHVFGGRTRDVADNLARHDVFDPRSGRWSSAAPLPSPRSSGAAALWRDRIVYAGGECTTGANGRTFSDVTAYDARQDRWDTLPPLTSPRHAFGAATVDGVAYFTAGSTQCGGGASRDLLTLRCSDQPAHRPGR